MKTLWTYPWDALEVGPETAAAEISRAGLDAVSLAATYHAFDQLRPRSTARRILSTPTSAAYYPFDPDAFDSLVPHRSDLVSGEDWSRVANELKSARLSVVAWTIFLHNSLLASGHPEHAQVTCSGDTLTHQLCPAQPAVRAYATTLAADICRLDQVDVLECESIGYGGWGHTHYHAKTGIDFGTGGRYLFSLCFCDACSRGAGKAGIDVAGLRKRTADRVTSTLTSGQPVTDSVDDLIASDEDLAGYQAFRDTTVTTLIQEVADAAGKPIRVLVMGDRHTSGLRVDAVADSVDAVEYLCYTNDTGRIRKTITEAAAQAGTVEKVGVGVQAYPPASRSADELKASVAAATEAGVDLISFYNYGIMPPRNIGWIREALGA